MPKRFSSFVGGSVVSFVLLVATSALAAPRPGLKNARLDPEPRRAEPQIGLSVGSPTEGHLLGGAHLIESPYVRIVPVYVPGDARWGLEPLVSMIDRAGRAVRKQFPDAVLSVGHLSRHGGGEIDRHASHESGRDADIGFYVKNQQHKPIYAEHFVPFRGDGKAPSWPGAEFDDARNWAFVAAIATDAHAHVSHIFVALPIRARLLQYAEKIGASAEVRTRAAELMAQPRGALPHDDHFHVRIGCPPGMEKCIEQPLAHKHGHGALARASSPPPAKAHAAGPHASTAAAAPARSARARGAGELPSKEKEKEKEKETRSDKSSPSERSDESVVPSLAPIVPGLDAAVIPAPLPLGAGHVHAVGEDPLPPGAQPIDDPDGVLDRP